MLNVLLPRVEQDDDRRRKGGGLDRGKGLRRGLAEEPSSSQRDRDGVSKSKTRRSSSKRGGSYDGRDSSREVDGSSSSTKRARDMARDRERADKGKRRRDKSDESSDEESDGRNERKSSGKRKRSRDGGDGGGGGDDETSTKDKAHRREPKEKQKKDRDRCGKKALHFFSSFDDLILMGLPGKVGSAQTRTVWVKTGIFSGSLRAIDWLTSLGRALYIYLHRPHSPRTRRLSSSLLLLVHFLLVSNPNDFYVIGKNVG